MEMIAGSRDIPLESVINVRDVGGIRTTSGSAVKRNRLIRGGRPDNITASDLDILTEQFEVTLFVDVRWPRNFALADDSEIVRQGVKRINLPLAVEIPGSGEMTDGPLGLIESGIPADFRTNYLQRFENPDRISKVMQAVGGARGASFLHCTAGKDRTGVLIAIALSAIGVHRDDVVADYAESGRFSEPLFEDVLGRSEKFQRVRGSLDPEVLYSYMSAPPEVMVDVLHRVDEKYGSPRQYLLNLPAGGRIVENLERKLLG
jgi:protein tyrosine/serine phosphatase